MLKEFIGGKEQHLHAYTLTNVRLKPICRATSSHLSI